MMDDDEVRTAIADLVQEEWKESSRPVPLTRLAASLLPKGIDMREVLAGRKLRQYIVDLKVPDVEVSHEPGNELIWHLMPAGVPSEVVFAPLLKRSSAAVLDASELPRFQKPFWTAFVKPVEQGKQRVIQLRPYIHFDDIDSHAPVPAGWILIEADLINADKAFADKFTVAANVERWLKEHGVPRDTLIEKNEPEKKTEDLQSSELISFMRRLSGLPKHELARVHIPLDLIVAALAEK